MGLKPLLAAILAFTNADNKRLNNAVETLRTLDLEGVCCVKFRICLCTWACVRENEQDAHLLLRRRVAELSKAVQGWGTCDVTEALGDPLLGVTATLPGMMPSSPAPVTAAPLQDAIGMWPLRSASPWKEGSLLFRTQDGKIMPFAPNSSEQAAWIDLGVARREVGFPQRHELRLCHAGRAVPPAVAVHRGCGAVVFRPYHAPERKPARREKAPCRLSPAQDDAGLCRQSL